MLIAIASDHAGIDAKKQIIAYVEGLGPACAEEASAGRHECTDFGPKSTEPVDYPDFAFKTAEAVASGKYQRGILICGTGLGMCIAANKVRGIRAVAPCDEFTAELSRKHNDANILCLGARSLKPDMMMKIIKVWMETPFESDGNASRHQKRLNKISDYEAKEK